MSEINIEYEKVEMEKEEKDKLRKKALFKAKAQMREINEYRDKIEELKDDRFLVPIGINI